MSPELTDSFNSIINTGGLLTKEAAVPCFISLASQTVVRSVAGHVHNLIIGLSSSPSLTLYDNASFASGTVIAKFGANLPIGSLLINSTFLNGLTISFCDGAAPSVTVNTH